MTAEVVAITVNVVLLRMLGTTARDELEVKPPGPVHVNEVTVELVVSARVLLWPGHITPELVAVTPQMRPQLVDAAPGELEFCC
jgi:hypothetical protein